MRTNHRGAHESIRRCYLSNCDFLQKNEDLNFIISHIELSLTNDWGVTTVIVGR